ncbi:hypothetical protein [Corynebacterium aquilae]|uniref:hypothetical protein n=1 Tax=Corynebacterium aquilae TaxID=203263 RepID=UPI0012ECD71B|nr:hypothetical protein [Corynebacterium aquilae]
MNSSLPTPRRSTRLSVSAPIFRTCLAVALCVSAVALGGCTIDRGAGSSTSTTTVTVTRQQLPPQPAPDPVPAPAEVKGNTFDEVLASLEPVLQGVTEVAIFDGNTVHVSATKQPGPAWSTIKVPLGMAAIAADPAVAQSSQLRQAITLSDNEAAKALWNGLGAGQLAADAVGAQIDHQAVVPATAPRPEFSPFGQTPWTPEQQAQFAFSLPCTGGAVYELMGQVDPSQSWGLGQIASARFKGGWGPDVDGTYYVRQFGTVDTASGPIGVAIATRAPDGSFESGTALLSQVASALGAALADNPGLVATGTC